MERVAEECGKFIYVKFQVFLPLINDEVITRWFIVLQSGDSFF